MVTEPDPREVEATVATEWRPTALITGAASGIGLATAELVLRRGGAVVAVDRTDPSERLGGGASVASVVGDVADLATNDAAVRAAEDRFGRPRHGGLQRRGDRIGARRVRRPGRVRALARRQPARLRPRDASGAPSDEAGRRCSVVMTASVSGLGGEAGRWPYGVAKAAVIQLARALAIDLALDDIRVNVVCPGPIRTGISARIEADDPDRYEALRRVVPLQR